MFGLSSFRHHAQETGCKRVCPFAERWPRCTRTAHRGTRGGVSTLQRRQGQGSPTAVAPLRGPTGRCRDPSSVLKAAFCSKRAAVYKDCAQETGPLCLPLLSPCLQGSGRRPHTADSGPRAVAQGCRREGPRPVRQIPDHGQPLRAAVEKGRGREEIKLLREANRQSASQMAAVYKDCTRGADRFALPCHGGPAVSGWSVDFWMLCRLGDGPSTSGRSVNLWMVRQPLDDLLTSGWCVDLGWPVDF